MINLNDMLSGGVDTVIFDMDDLMIDSHPIYARVFAEVFGKYGFSFEEKNNPLTNEEQAMFFGLKIPDVVSLLLKKYPVPGKSVEDLSREYNNIVTPLFRRLDIKSMPGLLVLIRKLQGLGLKLALASSSPQERIGAVLEKLALTGAFVVVVSGDDDVRRGKPAPDVFLKAAEKAGARPERCLVFEDAKNGVLAAKAAGMEVAGVHNRFMFQRLGVRQDLSAADYELESLEDIAY